MVTRNRSEDSNPPRWWDNLPPKVRNRFARPLARDEEPAPKPAPGAPPEPAPPVSRRELIGDLSRLALLFFLVACGNLLFLLVALAFVYG